jgi:hypothetical protein
VFFPRKYLLDLCQHSCSSYKISMVLTCRLNDCCSIFYRHKMPSSFLGNYFLSLFLYFSVFRINILRQKLFVKVQHKLRRSQLFLSTRQRTKQVQLILESQNYLKIKIKNSDHLSKICVPTYVGTYIVTYIRIR